MDCIGTVGYKNKKQKKKKKKRKIWKRMFFMQASDCVINYLNKNKFFVACPIYSLWYFFAH